MALNISSSNDLTAALEKFIDAKIKAAKKRRKKK